MYKLSSSVLFWSYIHLFFSREYELVIIERRWEIWFDKDLHRLLLPNPLLSDNEWLLGFAFQRKGRGNKKEIVSLTWICFLLRISSSFRVRETLKSSPPLVSRVILLYAGFELSSFFIVILIHSTVLKLSCFKKLSSSSFSKVILLTVCGLLTERIVLHISHEIFQTECSKCVEAAIRMLLTNERSALSPDDQSEDSWGCLPFLWERGCSNAVLIQE